MRLGRDGFSVPIYLRPSRQRTNRIVQFVCLSVLAVGAGEEFVHFQTSRHRRMVVGTQFHPYVRLVLLTSFLRATQRELDVLVDLVPVSFLFVYL